MTRRSAVGAALGVLAAASGAGLLLVSAWLISRAAEQPPVLFLLVAVVAVRALGVARSVLRYLERLVSHDAALRRLTEVRVAVWEGLRRTTSRRRHGDLVRRLTADVDAVAERSLRVRQPVVVIGTTTAGVVGLVLAIDPAAGLLLAACVALAGLGVPLVVRLAARRAQRRVAPLGGELAALAAEGVRTADELAAAGARDHVLGPLRDTADELGRASRRASWLDGLGAACVRIALGVAVAGAAWIGAGAVADGRLQPVLLAVVVLAPLALADLLEELPTVAQEEIRTRASLQRVTELTSARDRAGGLESERPGRPASGRPPRLVAAGLRAGWDDGPDVLHGVDLDVPPGSVVVVVGPSGSGKSTLARALLGLLPLRAGTVGLDGVSRGSPGDRVLRAEVGLLGQDEHVFDTTVAENLRLARPEASEERMGEALRAAGLGETIAASALGLDTPVGAHGSRLSGGERQRLGLARLLLADRRVLVLDEPTEHLDEADAARLVADLVALTPGRSLVVLTHQSAWLDHADTVLDLSRDPSLLHVPSVT